MYNDEQNLYHYTYRKDGTEPGQRYDAKQPTVDEQLNSYRQQQEQQTQNSQPVYQSQPQGGQTPHKNGKNRLGLKIASLALVCALLGGLVGGGTAYLVGNHSGSDTTEVNVSNRKPTEIQLKTVDGKNPMTDAESAPGFGIPGPCCPAAVRKWACAPVRRPLPRSRVSPKRWSSAGIIWRTSSGTWQRSRPTPWKS